MEAPTPTSQRPAKATVRRPDTSADLALSARQQKQRDAVERFNHKTFRSDWEPLMRELFTRVVEGCPFAMGLFTVDGSWGKPRLSGKFNYRSGQPSMLDYVRRHFKRKHYDHIANSLEGLAEHERFDLYKIVSPGLGLPVNALVYKIEHYNDPDLKAAIVFGGERLGGQMEVHLKLTAGILERLPTAHSANPEAPPHETRYTKLVAMLRAADPHKLRQTGLNDRKWSEVHEIVHGLEGFQGQFPELLKAKFVMLTQLLEETPPPNPSAPKP